MQDTDELAPRPMKKVWREIEYSTFYYSNFLLRRYPDKTYFLNWQYTNFHALVANSRGQEYFYCGEILRKHISSIGDLQISIYLLPIAVVKNDILFRSIGFNLCESKLGISYL